MLHFKCEAVASLAAQTLESLGLRREEKLLGPKLLDVKEDAIYGEERRGRWRGRRVRKGMTFYYTGWSTTITNEQSGKKPRIICLMGATKGPKVELTGSRSPEQKI